MMKLFKLTHFGDFGDTLLHSIYHIFSLYTPSAYLILKIQIAALKKGRRLFQSQRNYSNENSKLSNFLFSNNNY